MTDKPTRVPPARLVRAIGTVRARLDALNRRPVPGNIALLDMGTGAWITQILYVGAKLGIPDELAGGPARAEDVARRIGADQDAVARLMRAMASRGVLKHRRDGRFALTAVGQALRSDTPGSMRNMLLFIGHPARWADWGSLEHSVRTGEPAAVMLRGMPFFDYLATDPELAAVFNDAMTATGGMATDAAVAAYDFTGFRLIADVGGGHGSLLAGVLRQAPQARGLLYDLPSVVAGAGPTFEAAGVADRCATASGSFMDSVPDGADGYVMKNIIHDWPDDDAVRILRNVRTAIDSDGKLLLVEAVLPERASASFGELLDIEMLVTVGGKERTRTQYATLLSAAGFRLTEVVETAGPMSIVEAVPA